MGKTLLATALGGIGLGTLYGTGVQLQAAITPEVPELPKIEELTTPRQVGAAAVEGPDIQIGVETEEERKMKRLSRKRFKRSQQNKQRQQSATGLSIGGTTTAESGVKI